MGRDTRDTKYGTADSCKFFVCPNDHIHVIGYGTDDEPEYEIVLGKGLQQRCTVALRAIQMGVVDKVIEIKGTEDF